MKKIVVIGGGIAGLAAAYYAQKMARETGQQCSLTLIEKDPRWGGKIITERINGFVVEGGPDTFLATKPWAVNLCRELGLAERLHGTNPHQKNTYILRHGRLHPLPEGLTMMIPTRFSPMLRTSLLSWPAKARMGLDFVIPPLAKDGDESLGAFVSRRLGRQAYENLIEPLMSGIYAGDGDQLSLQATFPYLRELEIKHGGLVKGALATRRQLIRQSKSQLNKTPVDSRKPANRSIFLTPTTGLAEIVEALLDQLLAAKVVLRAGVSVKEITRAEGEAIGYLVRLSGGETVQADGLVLATPPFISAELLADLDSQLSGELAEIPFVSTATISLAYHLNDLPRPLNGYGYVIPRREGRKALACTWTSTKFPHRAPQGFSLLRVFAGRAGQEDQLSWDEAGLLVLAREELRITMGITAEPVFSRVYIWERAMPQYNLGHPARLERIDARLAQWPGIALAGNGYRGIGIPDCIYSGEQAARKVLD